ncbi:hypothetical protein [Promicromonospora iranensis]|jgi:hypothetical protein|uniref:hypothetical protein n=1 Tax=Promicromonospora iranensis TaxID=1105144 RepID=UPI0023A9FA71|nr:hypothetical protein [Promicromonospora iranensis]
MSGTVPPPPPPGGWPDEDPGAQTQEQHPPTAPTPAQQAPVQRVSAATRKPPAISPANQFSQAVTPAPAAPGAPVVQSVHIHNGGGEPQYYTEQYQQPYQQGYAQPQAYAQQAPQGGQYPPQGYPPQGYDQYGQPVYAAQPGGYPPEPPRERKKLSPGWIAFIALDVLLVIAAIVFAVNLLGQPDETPETSGTPAAEQPASPEPEEGLETDGGAGVETFAAPSLNITCTISADAATCGIAQLDQKPAPDAACDGASGYVAKVDPSGNVTQPCVGKKDQPKKAGGDIAILNYGSEKKAHGFTCLSDESGMKCVADESGSGFSIARAGIGAA